MSAKGLNEYYLSLLGIARENCWITDLVKVFLFKKEHIDNYISLGHSPPFDSTRESFDLYAKRSLNFLEKEIEIATPVLVLTLGTEVARVISNRYRTSSDELLTGVPYNTTVGAISCRIAHVAHPDARRYSEKWRSKTKEQMKTPRIFLKRFGVAFN